MSDSDTRDQPPVAGGGTLGVLALAAAAFALAQTAVVPGLTDLTRALHTSTANVSWVLSGYLVSAAIFTPIMGRLGDMFGKRRMLIVSLVFFAVGSVLAALSGDIWLLVAARVVQGVSGGIFPLCFGIISDTFPENRRPGALGLVSAIAGIGAGGGLLMGGLLIDHASWQWIFWVGAIMAAGAAAGALRVPASERRTPGRVDVPGALLLAVGLTALLLALTKTATWGWGDARTLGLVGAGLVVLVLFGLYERRAAEPLVNMRVFGRPAVLATNVTTMLVGTGMFGAFVLIPQIAQTPKASGYGFGTDATGAGLLLLPACLTMLVAGPLSGRLTLRFGPKVPLATGVLVAALGLTALAPAHGSRGVVIALSMVVFAGIGLSMAAIPNLIVRAVPPEMTGQATGVNALVRSIGSSIGSQVVATLLAASVTVAHPIPTDGAFTQAFWLGAGAALLAAVAASLVPQRKARGDTVGEPAAALSPAAPRGPGA
ncbi:MAG: MFS transporter [Actinoallomurus sp.]